MTRELSEQEKEAKFEAWDKYLIANGVDVMIGERRAFNTGFTAGLDYQQDKIDILTAALLNIIVGHSERRLEAVGMVEMARAAIAKARGQ